MKLLKINLIFIPLLALCLGAVGYAARKMLLEDARQHVLQNARLLMQTALSSRKYTIKYITPLILQYDYNAQTGLSEFRKSIEEIPTEPSPEAANNLPGSLKKGYLLGQQRALDEEKRFLESLERKAEEFRPTGFHPQSVSFFAALEILVNTPAAGNLIRQGKLDQLENTMQAGGQFGMRTMDSAVEQLFNQKQITGKEAYKKAINKSKFEEFRDTP